MANIEHPDITHAMQTGYSRSQWRDIQSREYEVERLSDGEPRYASDVYSTAIDRKQDEYVALPSGDYLSHKNLQRYLEERHAFEFKYEI